ncbi:MAG: ATP-binding protein [Oligoflexia bacterium]|nr:ATP-binding protein [Oligoflexia bacterium]
MAIQQVLLSAQLLAFCVTVLLAFHSFRLRRIRSAKFFSLIMIISAGWSLAAFLYLFLKDIELKILAIKFIFVTVPFVSPMVLLFAEGLTGKRPIRLQPWALFAIPVMSGVLSFTSSWHDLHIHGFSERTWNGLTILDFELGPGFRVSQLYSIALLIVSAVMFLALVFDATNKVYRWRALLSLIGLLTVTGAVFLGIFGSFPVRRLQLVPLTFMVAGPLFALAIFKYKSFTLAPVVREFVFEHIQVPILVIDDADLLLASNRAATELFGWGTEDRIGEPLSALLPGAASFITAISSLRQEPSRPVEWQWSESQDRRIFQVSSGHLVEPDRKGPRLILYLFDISARRQAELELESRNQTRSKLLSLIGHDLAGNIANLRLLSSMLREREDERDSESRRLIQMIAETSDTIYEFLEKMLVWLGSHQYLIEVKHRAFPAKELLDDVLRFELPVAKMKGVSLDCETPNDLVIKADYEMTGSILRNLTANSIKFTPAGGSITIRVTRKEDSVVFTVRDTGIGISKDRLSRILCGATAPAGPSGLGLIICRDFVDRQGGELFVDSEPGRGSVFGFSLPHREHARTD